MLIDTKPIAELDNLNGILRAMCPAHEQRTAQNMREVPQNWCGHPNLAAKGLRVVESSSVGTIPRMRQ
jgi:hypothetical protein